MNYLRNSRALQVIFGLLPLMLCMVYVFCIFSDLAMVYGTAKKNKDLMSSDESIVELVKYEQLDDTTYNLTESNGLSYDVENLEIGIVLSDESDLAWYSNASNHILQPTGKDYAKNFITGCNYWVVITSMLTLTLLIGCLCSLKNMGVLSHKGIFAVYVTLDLILLVFLYATYIVF